MAERNSPPSKLRPWLVELIVFVLAFDLAFAWQRLGGAQRSEFGGHRDEATHVVSGLLAHDALRALSSGKMEGFFQSPVRAWREFAADYAAHYPAVSGDSGHPAFHLTQALWTLLFGVSRNSLLLFMAALAAVLALLVFRALRASFGVAFAALGAALLLSLPLIRHHTATLVPELLGALLMLSAVLAFGRFLDRERRADALWFAALSAAAIWTVPAALALLLAAPLALLFTRRWRLLKTPALGLACGLLLISAAVAIAASPNAVFGAGVWGRSATEALPHFGVQFGLALGILPVLLFGWGVLVKVREPAPQQGLWAAAGALLLAIVIFQSLVPLPLETRHLLAALPCGVLFAIAGLHALFQRFTSQRENAGAREIASLVFVAVLLAASTWLILSEVPKAWSGFGPLAEELLATTGPAEAVMVSSDANGEGRFIAEVALRDRRPSRTIVRAGTMLAKPSTSGRETAAFETDEELLGFLTGGTLQYLVLDNNVPSAELREHHGQLKRVVAEHQERFWVIAEAPSVRGGERQSGTIKLYKISRPN